MKDLNDCFTVLKPKDYEDFSLDANLKLSGLLQHIFENQDMVNTKMGGEGWAESDNDYLAAAFVEAGELIESIGYEWWKPRSEDRNNTLIELCDLFTFSVSHALTTEFGFNARNLLEVIDTTTDEDPVTLVRQTIYELENYGFDEFLTRFTSLVKSLKFTLEDVVLTYYAKAKLNVFRTENGYKEGRYNKIWEDGKEDNYYLMGYLLSDNVKQAPVLESKIDKVFVLMSEHHLRLTMEKK